VKLRILQDVIARATQLLSIKGEVDVYERLE